MNGFRRGTNPGALNLDGETESHRTPRSEPTMTKPESGEKFTKNTSRSKKAGLQFPVSRIHRYMKNGKLADRISAAAPVFAAAVIEYLVAEVLELAGNAARDNKRVRINPRHVMLAVRNDEELNKLLRGVTIPSCGVLPNIHPSLLRKARQRASVSQPTPPEED